MGAALRQRPGLGAERSVDAPADQDERRDQPAEQDELQDEAQGQDITDRADDRRRGAEPDEKGARRERLDGAQDESADQPAERDEV